MASKLLYLGFLFTITVTCTYSQDGAAKESELILVPGPHRIIILDQKAPLLLNCSINITGSIQLYNYSWHKDGKQIEVNRVNRKKSRARDAERKKLKDLGRVSSQVTVFQNGSLYLPNGVSSLHGTKNLTKNRKLDGVYECIVNTSKGIALARKVKVVSANISQNFQIQPTAEDAYKGGVARFECKISSEPSTAYIWHKDNKEAQDPRFTILPLGVLQISDVQPVDEGPYWCQAVSQPFLTQLNADYNWKQSKKANLKVKTSSTKRFEILAEPKNVSAVSGETVYFECLVDGNPKPKISWMKLKVDVRDLAEDRTDNIYGPGNLRLLNIKPEDAGAYECTITPEKGPPIKKVAYLDVLEPPKIVQAPASYSVPVSKTQILFCKVTGNPTPTITWYHNGTNTDENPGMFPKDSTVDQLKLFSQQVEHSGFYTCVAENSVGQIMAYALARVFYGANPADQPVNVKVFPINSTAINVTWEQPVPATTYVLNYQVADVLGHPMQYLHPTAKGRYQHCEIVGLKPYTNYSVTITAFIMTGASKSTEREYVRTLEDVPVTVPIATLQCHRQNSVLVSWTPLTPSQSRGIIIGYKVYHRRIGDNGEVSRDVLADQTCCLIGGLEAKTAYELIVVAATKAGFPNADHYKWLTFTTPAQDDTQACNIANSDCDKCLVKECIRRKECEPTKLKAINITAQSLVLEWSFDTEVDSDYEICFSLDLETSSESCLMSKTNYLLFTDLKPNKKYVFKVRPLLPNVTCNYSHLIVKTKEDVPSPPINVTVEVIKANIVQVKWLPPSEPHGVITSYIILYTKEVTNPSDFNWKTITQEMEEQNDYSAQVEVLEPGVYFFKLTAVNSAGVGMPSDNQTIEVKCFRGISFCDPIEQAEGTPSPSNQKGITLIVGIVVGIFILAVIIFLIVYCWRRRAAARSLDPNSNHSPIYRGNGHVSSPLNPSGHKPGNGHAHIIAGNGSGDSSHEIINLPETTPMLLTLTENEQSDSKGPPGMIMTNGLRSNGIIRNNHKTMGQTAISRSAGDLNSSNNSEELQLLMVSVLSGDGSGTMGNTMEMIPMSRLEDIDHVDDELGDHSSEDSGTGCRRAGMPCTEHNFHGCSPASSPGGTCLHGQRSWEKGRPGDEFGGVIIDSSTGAAIKLVGAGCNEEQIKSEEDFYDDGSSNDRDSGHGSEAKSHIGIENGGKENRNSPKEERDNVPALGESKDLLVARQSDEDLSQHPVTITSPPASPQHSQQQPSLSSRNLFNNRPEHSHRQHQRGPRQHISHSDLPLPPPPPPPHLSLPTLPSPHQGQQAAVTTATSAASAAASPAELKGSGSTEEGGQYLSSDLGSILYRQLEGKAAVSFSPPRPPPSPPHIA